MVSPIGETTEAAKHVCRLEIGVAVICPIGQTVVMDAIVESPGLAIVAKGQVASSRLIASSRLVRCLNAM